jgi:phenylalanyl-tRNA synthetase beta chain
MKFTLSWLKDHLETDAPLSAICDALTDLGLEIEAVVDPVETLGAFTICRVIEAKQHPNADRLRVCRVEAWPDGTDQPAKEVQVVCGAPNARTGMVGVFAAPGTYVPGTALLLKEGKIRGEVSAGMLCSGLELTVSDDHDGVLDLPDDAPLGARYIDYAGLNDPMIEIAITPNRPDALGVRGIARDLAARGLGRLKDASIEALKGEFESPIQVSLAAEVRTETDESAAACPVFVGVYMRAVQNRPSPDWMQARLRAIGINPKNALVDITNYVSFDRARPLHAFDADKLEGDIKVRLAKAGEKIVGLDDREHVLDAGMTVICDQNGARPVAIGGVMGGLETGCDENTKNVFLESAYFDPVRTATTGRKLKINSDARYRFDRGIDPLSCETGAFQGAQLAVAISGGQASKPAIAGKPEAKGKNGYQRSFTLDPKRVQSLVGLEIPRDAQIRILESLGFEIKSPKAKMLTVSPPSWRPDVHGEADLVEEITRVSSLAKLRAQPLPRMQPGVAKPVFTIAQRRVSHARRILAALGLCESVNYSFISPMQASLFGGGDQARRLENPIATDKSDMRPSLVPGLLAAAARNQARGVADVSLFEIGAEFFGAEPGEQRDVATAIRVGSAADRHWSGQRRSVDVFDAKRDAEAVLSLLGTPVDKLMIDRNTGSWMHPSRSALLKRGPKTTLAEFGELHPQVVQAFDIKGPAVAMTVYLDAIPSPKSQSKVRPAVSKNLLQAVTRDFAFVLDERIEAAAVLRAARSADKKLIVNARVFDVFSGSKAINQFGEGKKSIAISVTIQPIEKTLTDEQIENLSQKLITAVNKKTGGHLRK